MQSSLNQPLLKSTQGRGVTTLQMRDHVRSTLGQAYQRLQTISSTTYRRLLQAPAKNVLASKYYFASSQVKYGYELAALYLTL
ncbi:unnamed protein product [Didymodactylos carnosus]|uniref:Uncharacterized protein n=1 Tax=Didymodactylos carnosus TaxID=1234261 RepID=A0A815D8Q3_9BILA|nr:unnamed protein product [Didymodactylos carnosus]CAF4114707.1 unnamed protein product [Didymodactylos carnosus]